MFTEKEVMLTLLGAVAGAVIGIFIEAFIGTPIKYIVAGDWIRKRKAKRREEIKAEIYNEIKENKTKQYDTEYFYEKYKKDVKSIFKMYKLIEEIEYDGRLRKLAFDGQTMETQIWLVNM